MNTAQQFPVRFSAPWGTGGRRAYPNDYGFAGNALLELDAGSLRIVGKRHRFLIPDAPQTVELQLSALWNVAAADRIVTFEVQEGPVTKAVKLWAPSPADATAIVAALPDRQTDAFRQKRADQKLFADRLQELGGGAPVTYTLLALNILVFVYAATQGADVLMPDGAVVIKLGSNYGPATLGGEWWRLLSCTFLHFGIVHLVANMAALAVTGPLVERLYGSARYLTLYLVAGVIASATSVAWNPEVNSAGASGAIMGVFGALLAVAMRNDTEIPRSILVEKRNAILVYTGYTLLYGVAHRGIDNAAHIGGFVAGFVTGLTMMRPLAKEQRLQFAPGPYAIALALGVSVPWLLYKTHPRPAALHASDAPAATAPGEAALSQLDFDRPCDAELVEGAASAGVPGLANPSLINDGKAGEPDYPARGKELGEEGRAITRIVINEKGEVAHVSLDTSSGYTDLDNAALRYTARMTFHAATHNGVPVCFAKKMAIRYVLKR